jgi:thiamine-phosphate pyrophosphorylase
MPEPPIGPQRLRVYVVTSSAFAGRSHRDVALAGIEGGATAVQLRAPELDDDALEALAREIAPVCRGAGVLLVVNDRPAVATAAGADGVHVGQGDDIEGARSAVGPGGILGISVATPAQARAAEAAGAQYLGVTVWATTTKPEARPEGLGGVAAVTACTSLPVIGIGGIDETNAADVIAAGAAGVAVISAVAAAGDPVAVVRRLRAAVDRAIERREADR